MGFANGLALVVLSYHLLILHSAAQEENTAVQLSSCPKSFICGNLGNLSFPFTNHTFPVECGLCTINCDERPFPKIKLGIEEKHYDLKSTNQEDEMMKVHDPELENLLKTKNCESFDSFSLPNSPSISFRVLSNITLFKCIRSPQLDEQTEIFFTGNLSYKDCPDYNIYYSYPNNLYPSRPLPPNCFAIHMPLIPPETNHINSTDLFSLLATEFSIEYHVSDRCYDCHSSRGRNNNKVILATVIPAAGVSIICLVLFICWQRHKLGISSYFLFKEHFSSDPSSKADLEGGSVYFGVHVFSYSELEEATENFDPSKELGDGGFGTVYYAASIAGVGIFVILTFFVIRRKTSQGKSMIFWKKKTENYRSVEAFLKSHGSLAPKRFNFSEVKKMTNNFKVKLGQGGYGSVYKGNLPNGCLVAVKVLNETKGSGEEFINEVASISRTSHVNIVTLLGFCFEGSKRALIYEFLPNGSLEKFIYEGNPLTERTLSWGTLFQISVGIARGLEYLHRGCKTRILHFDIKPHNILLDEDFCPKISDFSLAKLCNRKESVISMLDARGTLGYVAPEVFCRNFGGVSHKSDVYSYGMMVMEMVGGRKNIDVGVDHTSEIYFPHWIYKRVEQEEELELHGIKNDEERESARKMIVVGLWCIQTIPSDRPSMSRVVEMLEGSVESLEVPPKPFLSSPSRPSVESSGTLVP